MLITAYYSDPSKDKEVEKLAASANAKARGFVITPRYRSFQLEIADDKGAGFKSSLKVKGYELERPGG